jgi:hypothetical protein
VGNSKNTSESTDSDTKTKTVNGIQRRVVDGKLNVKPKESVADKIKAVFLKGTELQQQSSKNAFRVRNNPYVPSDASGYKRNINARPTIGQNFNTGGGGKQQPARDNSNSNSRGGGGGGGGGGGAAKKTPPPKRTVQRGRVQATAKVSAASQLYNTTPCTCY